MKCTVQVSNHPQAGRRFETEEGIKSWQTLYVGPIADEQEMVNVVHQLEKWYRNTRIYKGDALARPWYASYNAPF